MAPVLASCGSGINAEVIRLTRLDVCGVPVTGTGSAIVVMDGFTQVQATPNYEDGQRFLLRQASGRPCVNTRAASFLNWVELQVDFCTLDPTALTLVSGDRLISNGVTGIGAAFGEGLLNQHFSLELWQPVAGSSACVGGTQNYFYWAWPNAFSATFGAMTFQNDTFTLQFNAITQAASTSWVQGDPWLPGTGAFLNDEHWGYALTTVAPPVAACGSASLP